MRTSVDMNFSSRYFFCNKHEISRKVLFEFKADDALKSQYCEIHL